MGQEVIIHRDELYGLVWAEPTVQIARRFNVSDVAISKICKKMNIPKPGLGYWAKIRHGKRVRRIPLPPLKPGDPESYTIRGAEDKELNLPQSALDEHRIFESKPVNHIEVKSTLRKAHPLVSQAMHELSSRSKDQYSRQGRPFKCLDVEVGKDSLHRALRIMDALLKALERRGYTVSIKGEYGRDTVVTINGVDVSFGIIEGVRRIQNPKKKKDVYDFSYSPYEYILTGKLTLRVKEYHSKTKTISDGKEQRLENCLNRFVLMLIKASEYKKAHSAWLEEQHAIWEEERKQTEQVKLDREQEERSTKLLFDGAVTWSRCKQVRDFISDLEALSKKNDDSSLEVYVNWAREKVEGIESSLISECLDCRAGDDHRLSLNK